jgi:hypothetical protein
MFNTNNFSWFKQNFPRHDFALLWHELHPNEHKPLFGLTQNMFFPGLVRAWDKLGYEGFYDNSNEFFQKILKPAVRIRQEHSVNMSWMVARAVRLLQPLTFVLAVNITLARIREYNKWQPLSVRAKITPPVLNIFCAVEMVAIDAAVPVHIIHSEALLRELQSVREQQLTHLNAQARSAAEAAERRRHEQAAAAAERERAAEAWAARVAELQEALTRTSKEHETAKAAHRESDEQWAQRERRLREQLIEVSAEVEAA